jgi:predicted dehydrogenase
MNYALIGCGRVAYNHLKAAGENGLNVVAVCDTEPDHIFELYNRAGLSPEQAGAIARYADWNRLFDEEKPTLVSIALPSGLHAACAKDAIRRGIHVIVEKPIALSMADADEIVRMAEEYHVKVSACHQNRFNLAVQEMRRYLEAGRFGTLSNAAITVRWGRDRSYYASADWRGTWAMDGGALMNQSIHGIDLLRWMCGGELKTVYGVTRRQHHPYIQAEDVGAAVLSFANGCVATLEGGVNVCGPDLEEHLTLIGSGGAMKLGGKSANTVEYRYFEHEGAAVENGLVEQTANVYGNGHISLFRDVVCAIEEDRAPYVTAKDGRDALETVLAVYLSAKTGQPVTLPLKDVSTTDFEGLFE